MTFQDFLAASQGDERLAMARWLAHKINKTQTAEMWSIVPPDILEGMSPDVFSLADAVLAELTRQREADKARIEVLKNRARNEEYHICKYWDSLDEARKIYDLRRPINQ